MSLYDKARMIFSGAAAMGKPKVAHNIKPVEKLKPEEFAKELSDTHWTKNTGIQFKGGEAIYTDVVRYRRIITKDKIFKSGKRYRVSFEIEDFVGEQVDSDQYSSNVQTVSKLSVQQVDNVQIINDISKSGKYSAVFTAKDYTNNHGETFTSNGLTFKVVSGSVSCKIKNVSVREIREESIDMGFERNTDLGATRIQADGAIEKCTQNFLLNSNRFDSDPWDYSNEVLTEGQYGYDQSYNAWKVEANNDGGVLVEQAVSPSTEATTFSYYVKAGPSNSTWTHQVCRVDYADSDSFSEVIFRLSDGVRTAGGVQVGTRIGYEIEQVGADGWYRVAISVSAAIDNVRIYSHNGSNTGVTDGDYVFIQNAQLEPGIATTTYIDTDESEIPHVDGILEDQPRYDYTGSVNDDPILLLEPPRTNYYEYSEAASQNPTNQAATITEKYADSPDGSKNAFRIQDTGSGSYKRVNTTSFSRGTDQKTYTFSVFVKKATSAVSTYGGAGINFHGATQKVGYMIFDEYNGTATSPSDSDYVTVHPVEDINGYWRFSFSWTDSGDNPSVEGILYACLSTDGTSVTAPTTKDYTAYGIQIEDGGFPTSYIPTHGATVQRTQDNTSSTAYDGINRRLFDFSKSWGVYLSLGKTKKQDDSPSSIPLLNLYTFNNDESVALFCNTQNTGTAQDPVYEFGLNLYMKGNGGYVFGTHQNDALDADESKVCAFYNHETGHLAYWINGTEYNSTTTDLSFKSSRYGYIVAGFRSQGGSDMMAQVKELIIFDKALTDTEAEDLTTL